MSSPSPKKQQKKPSQASKTTTESSDSALPATTTPDKKFQELTVNYDGENVQAHIEWNDFSVRDVDAWIRSRFGLKADEALRFMDKLGAEMIPSKKTLESSKYHIYVKKINNKKSSGAASSPSFASWIFPYVFLALTVSLAYVGLYYNQQFAGVIPLKQWCDAADEYMIALGFYQKKGIVLEAFMAVICWSTTYLFIRRLWNPETMKGTFEKYSADSFFGGLAAGGSIIMKNILLSTLADKKI